MSRPFIFVVVVAAAFYGWLAFNWTSQPPSNQELLANTAKAVDMFKGWLDVGGPAWWTPNFLQGTSLAPLVGHLTTSAWLVLWVAIAGILTGPKIAALICLFLGTLAVYGWINALVRDKWIAAAASMAFLLTPSIYVRTGVVEHMVFVTSFAVIPMVLWSLTLLVRKPSPWNGLSAGITVALLLLTYAKAAALLLPVMVVYFLVLWIRWQSTWRLPILPMLLAFVAIVLLGILPNTPSLRELKFAGVFELSPFEAWQNAFSLKSSLLWIDRDGILTHRMPDTFAPSTAQGGNYLGLITFLVLAATLFARPRDLYESSQGFALRFLLALALIAHWLSFGPQSVLGGQLAFLKMAVAAENVAIPLSWLLLVGQIWIIFRLLPPQLAGRIWVGAALAIVYLLIPGFRLISWLPIYSDLRAPHDFSQIIGIFFLAGAVACAAFLGFRKIPSVSLKVLATVAVLGISFFDISCYLRPFFKSPLSFRTFQDFIAAEEFLARAPINGWVYPVSGRYFYLLTTHLSGRGLATEAFNSYLMQRGMNYLQSTAFLSPTLMRSYLNIGGIAYVLIDKKDPDTDERIQQFFASILNPVFENEHFVILGNPTSLAPGTAASYFVSGTVRPGETAKAALMLEKYGIITLPDNASTAEQKENVGRLEPDGYVLKETFAGTPPAPLTRLFAPPLNSHYQLVSLPTRVDPGWIVLPMSYHPDWKAYAGVRLLPVDSAEGALLAVKTDMPNQSVTLRFEPPLWYNGSLALSGISWLVGVSLLGFGLIPGNSRLRRWLHRIYIRENSPSRRNPLEPSGGINRALVVVPTYNEIKSLPVLLERILPIDVRLEVLVVDDNSPDGTGAWVRQHPEFNKRIHLMERAGKLGLGTAYKEGFQWAINRGYDACLEMDADLSHDPADIPRLIAALEYGADAAIGSRYLGGVRVMNWPEHRLLLSTSASRFVHLVTGLPLTDATSGFKAIRTSILRDLDWKKFRAGGYGFQVELHFFLWQLGARLVEVPIVFTERRDGETKMSLGIALEAAWRTVQLALGGQSKSTSSQSE